MPMEKNMKCELSFQKCADCRPSLHLDKLYISKCILFHEKSELFGTVSGDVIQGMWPCERLDSLLSLSYPCNPLSFPRSMCP